MRWKPSSYVISPHITHAHLRRQVRHTDRQVGRRYDKLTDWICGDDVAAPVNALIASRDCRWKIEIEKNVIEKRPKISFGLPNA